MEELIYAVIDTNNLFGDTVSLIMQKGTEVPSPSRVN